MASYNIRWKKSAAHDVRKLPPDLLSRILEAVKELSKDPYEPGTRKLVGTDRTFRFRVGDHRIVYNIGVSLREIEIVRVAHRREVYRSK
ncbi:MAG: type II toxin-antitoxin system RelE/ParE family toxin [Candidatus Hydrogenedentes bacterium]|nr:type II toxin-antitoxin system RelE/ParE family toxin [Candidatus Hydrogenedentota bacterium]